MKRELAVHMNTNLEFEISEIDMSLDEIVKEVESEYPFYRFNRTEKRYDSCIFAIFEMVAI